MKSSRIYILSIVLIIGLNQSLLAGWDISRGHQSGELYFSSTWYWTNDVQYNVICYTDDFGQSLSFKYICDISLGEMQPENIIQDATVGVFYNAQASSLWKSQDYCMNWEEITPEGLYATYASGLTPGEIYKVWTNEPMWRVELLRSSDYGNSFDLVNESISGESEVGNEPGEVYHYHLWQEDSVYFKINFSIDNGNTFNLDYIHNSAICGLILMGHYPRIYHGSEPGELYLISWHLPEYFKIFHSTDYGASFEHRFTSPLCDFYFEGYLFTPGFDQGTFYYIKGLPWFDGTNTKVHIYYSTDTAKTFTEYIHVLDSSFPVNIYEDDVVKHKDIELSNYPNPFSNNTSLSFNLEEPGTHTIELTSLSGQSIFRKEEYFTAGQQKYDLITNQLCPGIYLCAIKSKGRVLGVRKIVKR